MRTIRYYYLRTIGFPYLCYLTLIGVHYLQYKDTYFISIKKIIMNLFSLYFLILEIFLMFQPKY